MSLTDPDERFVYDTSVPFPTLIRPAAVPLFGELSPQELKPASHQSKPTTHIQVRLLGTVLAGEASAAIVAFPPAYTQHVFVIGDYMQPDMQLQQVMADAILIGWGGKTEKVMLSRHASPDIPATVHLSDEQKTSVKLNRHFVQRQLQNLPALLSQARAVPHYLNGTFDGFSMMDIMPDSIFQRLGMRNGDVLRSVNRTRFSSLTQAMQVYQQLKTAKSLDVELMRGHKRLLLHLDIQ